MYPFGNFVLVFNCSAVTVVSVRLADMWLSSHFTFSVRVPPCGQTSECPLPTSATSVCFVQNIQPVYITVNLADHSPLSILPSFFSEMNSGIASATQRSLRASTPTGVAMMLGSGVKEFLTAFCCPGSPSSRPTKTGVVSGRGRRKGACCGRR